MRTKTDKQRITELTPEVGQLGGSPEELFETLPLMEKLAESTDPEPHKWRDDEPQERGRDLECIYLRDIGRAPLLSREQEVDLAQAFEAGQEAEANLKRDEASPDETEELRRQIRRGEEARDQLTIANLQLGVYIAKRYLNRGVSFLDLIQEGNMGLMRAVQKFDWRKGYKFSTYATWWIRQSITRAIADQARTIRVPIGTLEELRKLRRLRQEHIQESGVTPTYEELASLLGTSVDRVKNIDQATLGVVSLDQPFSDGNEAPLGDFLADTSVPSPSREALRAMLKEELRRVLQGLDRRAREIIELRYGLRDGHPCTLKEVGIMFGISRERVRQIEARALDKLKNPSRQQVLRKFRSLLSAEE